MQHRPSDPPASRSPRGPRVVEVLLMLAVPLIIFLVDVDVLHRAGHPRRPWNRARAAIARRLRA